MRSPCRRFFFSSSSARILPAAGPTSEPRKLVREHIDEVLYAPKTGYFNSNPRIVSPENPIPFNRISSRKEYYELLLEIYGAYDTCWTTPVEIFHPYYAQGIARWILSVLENRDLPKNVIIVEIGGGNGTCALGLMDFLRENAQELYPNVRYLMIDLSSEMSKQQTLRLSRSGHYVEKIQGAAHNPATFDNLGIDPSDPNTEVFIVGNEVLDNMPHDKIVLDSQGTLWQVELAKHSEKLNSRLRNTDKTKWKWFQYLLPLEDHLIKEYLNVVPSQELLSKHNTIFDQNKGLSLTQAAMLKTQSLWFDYLKPMFWQSALEKNENPKHVQTEIFIPTTSFLFLKTMLQVFPSHHIFLADFDSLDTGIEGINAPAVSAKDESTHGETIDFPDITVEVGAADIFFPTSFPNLARAYNHIMSAEDVEVSVEWAKSSVFLQRFTDTSKTKIKSKSFNPLLDDYGNTQVFTASRSVKKV